MLSRFLYVESCAHDSLQAPRAMRCNGAGRTDRSFFLLLDHGQELRQVGLECADPVLHQLGGDRSQVDAGFGQRGDDRCRLSTRSTTAAGRTLPWSRNASSVAWGMVLTVSGPTSSSTQRTSE